MSDTPSMTRSTDTTPQAAPAASAAPTGGSNGEWFVSAFGEAYPLIYAHRDDASADGEAAGVAAMLDLQAGERLLDIACGGGRHAAAFARRGMNVTGIDLSAPLLAAASQRAELRGRVVRADVRALPFDAAFDAATNLFTSFGYFETDDENAAALMQMAQTLRPGGRLCMDHAHRAYVEATLVETETKTAGDMTLHIQRSIVQGRVVKRTRVVHADGREQPLLESVRLFTVDQITALFEQAGLDVVRIAGGFAGGELAVDSDRMIVCGVKR